jgi:hypothetical protein
VHRARPPPRPWGWKRREPCRAAYTANGPVRTKHGFEKSLLRQLDQRRAKSSNAYFAFAFKPRVQPGGGWHVGWSHPARLGGGCRFPFSLIPRRSAFRSIVSIEVRKLAAVSSNVAEAAAI